MAVQSRAPWKDAFDAQGDLLHWLQSKVGRDWMQIKHDMWAEELPHFRHTLRLLYESEVSKVSGADTYFVSEEMCELVEYASEAFKPEALLTTDLLTDQGFVYFAKPFAILDRDDVPIHLRAVSWSPLLSDLNDAQQSALDFFLSSGGSLLDWMAQHERVWTGTDEQALVDEQTPVNGLAITLYSVTKTAHWSEQHGPPPAMVPMHLTPWWFGMPFEGNEVDALGNETGTEQWWKVVQSCLRLMQQRIAVRHQERPDRAQRRNAQRSGWRHDPEVKVIRLRKERDRRHPDGEGEPVAWTHRHIRDGHWRNQFYPASDVHRQIWIHETVVGPDWLPLVIKPKAYVWDR